MKENKPIPLKQTIFLININPEENNFKLLRNSEEES